MRFRSFPRELDGPIFLLVGAVLILIALFGKYDQKKWSDGGMIGKWINRKYGELAMRFFVLIIGILILLIGIFELKHQMRYY